METHAIVLGLSSVYLSVYFILRDKNNVKTKHNRCKNEVRATEPSGNDSLIEYYTTITFLYKFSSQCERITLLKKK